VPERADRGCCTDGRAHRLVLEGDDSLIRWDNQRLIEFTRRHGSRDSLSYEFMRANEELLLGLPDAIAWCWTKGGPLARPHHRRSPRPPGGLNAHGQREARLTNRPDGCRAHFLKLTATGSQQNTTRTASTYSPREGAAS
jgi:hypothetical protein